MKPAKQESDKVRKINKKDVPIQLLAFTFFYSVSIYACLVSFLYWREKRDTESDK